MSYKKLKSIGFRHNSLDSKLCRQYAAKYFIEFLEKQTVIINIDESILNQTDPRQYGWFGVNQKNFKSHSQRLDSVSIIGGVSSKGDFYYSLNYGKNNSDTFCYFLIKLVRILDQQNPFWRNDTVFMLDNASYHRSKKLIEFYQKMRIPVLFLGPYQYRMAPIEMMFSYIKGQDMNKLKSRGETLNQIIPLVKEIAMFLSQINTSWVQGSFRHVLIAALESLALKDL